MNKIILPFFLILSAINLHSQEILFEKTIGSDTFAGSINNTETIPIVDKLNNEIAVFLLNKNHVFGFQFDNNYKLKNNYISKKNGKKYNTLLGYSKDSTSYNLFFTDKKKKLFYSKSINFTTKKDNDKIYEFKLKNEAFLSSISQNKQFYILSIKKNSSILILRAFSGNQLKKIEQFDLSSYNFSNLSHTTLSSILLGYEASLNEYFIQKIESDTPNSLELTSKKNKLYCIDNKIYITINNLRANTKLITIDLASFKYNVQIFSNGIIDCKNKYNEKANSFLYKNTLFQIKGCKNELYFTIYDIETNKLIKEYRVQRDDEIIFKN